MLHENVITSTVAVDRSINVKVDRYVDLGQTIVGDHDAHCTRMGNIQGGGQHYEEQAG